MNISNDLTGQRFGKYRLIRKLGIGGFASVYLGQHSLLTEQQVAIKVLHLFDVDAQRFQAEAAIMVKLKHPAIIRLFDFDFQDGTPYLVMDYAPQGSLAARHPHGQRVPLVTVLSYLKQIVPALQYAHDQHIIHRDLKPDNILIGSQGELLLADFGIAVLSKTGRTTREVGYGMAGTSYYMAPEQWRGKPEKASDQYALAVIVYSWLCGTWPFDGDDAMALAFQHNYEPVPSLCQQVPSLFIGVEEVILKALAKQPQERFPSVAAFVQALEQASRLPAVIATSLPPSAQLPHVIRQNWQVLRTLQGHTDHVLSLAWSPSGKMLASCSSDRTIRLWNPRSGQLLRTISEQKNTVYRVKWSPDGQMLAAGNTDDTIRLWNPQNSQLLRTLKGHSDDVTDVGWSPDGKTLASCSHDQTIRLWNPQNSRLLRILEGHTNFIWCVVWSPDGKMLASCGSDRTIRLWNPQSGQLLHILEGHTSAVESVGWSSDGRTLASCGDDNTIRIWNPQNGQLLHTLTGHTEYVYRVVWSPYGKILASCSWDHTIKIWVDGQ